VIFTSKSFVDTILSHIVAAKPVGDPGRRLVLHMDKDFPYRARLTARNLEENRITVSPHPTFSLDLGPSDFFLFGALKGQLSGLIFESRDELVEAKGEIASDIPRQHLRQYFSNGKKDCSDVSTSMVPMSTKVYDSIIYPLRFLL
jgi:hypothetical protein